MRQFTGFFLLTALMMLLPSLVLAEPQPRSISGIFDGGEVVRVFGQDFGEAPAAELFAEGQGAPENWVSCVLVGDMPTLDKCTIFKWMPLVSWSPTEIQFRYSGEGLAPLQKFYFFIKDAEGRASWGVGPWQEGMGILASSGKGIGLELENDQFKPSGDFPGVVDGADPAPGIPGQPVINQFGEANRSR